MLVLTTLLWVIGGLLFLLLLGMLTPLRLRGSIADVQWSETTEPDWQAIRWEVKGRWLLGTVALRASKGPHGDPSFVLRILGVPIKINPSPSRSKTKAKAKGTAGSAKRARGVQQRSKKHGRGAARLSMHEILALIGEAKWFLGRMWRTVRLRGRGEMTYGFSDPYLTAMVHAVRVTVPVAPDLRVIPDFTETKLEGWATIGIDTIPVRSMLVLVRTAFRKGVRQVWWSRLRTRVQRMFRGRRSSPPVQRVPKNADLR